VLQRRIVWDEAKNRTNRTKHGFDFSEAAEVFLDPLALTVDDPDHSWNEQRFVTIGKDLNGRLMIVFYTENDREIRIISARKSTAGERRSYEGD
jgi:uncharacterized DUF497 family protein